MKDSIITGLDIGSSAIRAVVGRPIIGGESSAMALEVIGAAEQRSEGVHRGTITSVEAAASAISALLERLERMVGVPIESAWIGISGSHIASQSSKGVV